MFLRATNITDRFNQTFLATWNSVRSVSALSIETPS